MDGQKKIAGVRKASRAHLKTELHTLKKTEMPPGLENGTLTIIESVFFTLKQIHVYSGVLHEI